jgi:hypothetical protein
VVPETLGQAWLLRMGNDLKGPDDLRGQEAAECVVLISWDYSSQALDQAVLLEKSKPREALVEYLA